MPVGSANTICHACDQRGRKAVEDWTRYWASVLAWVEETKSQEQDGHPQWMGTLSLLGEQEL